MLCNQGKIRKMGENFDGNKDGGIVNAFKSHNRLPQMTNNSEC